MGCRIVFGSRYDFQPHCGLVGCTNGSLLAVVGPRLVGRPFGDVGARCRRGVLYCATSWYIDRCGVGLHAVFGNGFWWVFRADKPFFQETLPACILAAEGAVYDLVGQGFQASGEVDGWTNAMLCHYQTQHSHSVAEDCVAVGSDVNPRMKLGAWLAARLYEGDLASVVSRMRRLEFTAIALHSDWINASDQFASKRRSSPSGTSEKSRLQKVWCSTTSIDKPPFGMSPKVRRRASSVRKRDKCNGLCGLIWQRPPIWIWVGCFGGGRTCAGGTVGWRWGRGERLEDGVYVGRFEGWVSGSTQVRLYRVLDEKHVVLWSGPIMPLDLDEDMVSFKTLDGRTATPFLRSLDTFSPEIRHRGDGS